MKFIPVGDKHLEYDSFEDYPQSHDCGSPRKIPSYFDTAKKRKTEKAKDIR